MTNITIAALGAIGGAVVTALASVVITFYQRRSALENEHRLRAFERNLPHYERIFIAARSTQDALRDYVSIEKRISDRSDLFLRQLLSIVADWAHQYCVAVNWQHNSGMAYLDIRLEEKCLRLRNLLLLWLSRQRVSSGNVAFIVNNGVPSPILLRKVRSLQPGDYQELRIEKRIIVTPHSDDQKMISNIDRMILSVIADLKAVMSY
jgi:hypothetical protein